MLSSDRKQKIIELLDGFGICGRDIDMYDVALTHPSFHFELNKTNMPDYERLEFIGDSVLRLCVSNYLYEKYMDYDEGKLTKLRSYLVSDEFLSKIALELKINEYLNIGEHEEKDGGRKKESILACAMEAVLGAIYKDLGFQTADDFINKIYSNLNINMDSIFYLFNSKELLQQYTQGLNKDLPLYELVSESGHAHDKIYEVNVLYNNKVLGNGKGKTKKEAEKNAAYSALKTLDLIGKMK